MICFLFLTAFYLKGAAKLQKKISNIKIIPYFSKNFMHNIKSAAKIRHRQGAMVGFGAIWWFLYCRFIFACVYLCLWHKINFR